MTGRGSGDVVVLLPGILGSVLTKDGRDVWGASAGAAFQAISSLGGSIKDLALDEDPPEVDDLGDGVRATSLMPDVHLIPWLWKIDGYSKIESWILENLGVKKGETYFPFPYDWRRDVRVAARRLETDSRAWLSSWRERSGNDGARLILVAHSLGGLVARHFLEVLDGWKDTRMLVTFGTPYRGSLNAVDFIANGFKKKVGPLTLIDLSELLRSLTSVYQLLPIYPCFDPGDRSLIRVSEAGTIPNVDIARAQAALAFHRTIEEAVTLHRQDETYVNHGYRIHPIVGTFQPTRQSAKLDGRRVVTTNAYEGEDMDGDGTVPRVSATPIELSDAHHEVFISERHASLQNDDGVLVQLAGLVSGVGLELGGFRDIRMSLGLDVDDAFLSSAPVEFTVRCDLDGAALAAVVYNVDTNEHRTVDLPAVTGGSTRGVIDRLPAGAYRIQVVGGPLVSSVTDVFLVFDENQE